MICCFGFVVDPDGSMVLVMVLAVCFFFFRFMADPEGLWWFVVLGFWW